MTATRLLYVVTHPMTARYCLRGQFSWMRQQGFEVAVAAAPGPDLEAIAEREGVEVMAVPMMREISPVSDLRALQALRRRIRAWRPDIVNAGTPKAGLLGLLAARLESVPVRIYTLHGLRLETTRGLLQRVLRTTEKTTARSAHEVIAVSRSLADEFVRRGLAGAARVTVLAHGTANGIETHGRFPPDREAVRRLRTELNIPTSAPVVGFVGRLTRDKGITHLVEAFGRIRQRHRDARLLLVGGVEAGDPLPPATLERIQADPAIITTGFLEDPVPAYGLMDVMAFPSYREGLGMVVLEAGAAGLPVVGFRATGTVDAVLDGVTGTLVDVGDTAGLAEALTRYLDDAELSAKHGASARERVVRDFQPAQVCEALRAEYERLLDQARRGRR